jgi:glycosyltransferase involved in cell wall biosynthesis
MRGVAMIVTRDLDEVVGRVRTLSAIRAAVERTSRVRLFRIRALFESPRVLDVIKATLLWLGSVMRREPMPLQCVLYARQSDISRIVAAVEAEKCHAVYVDGVRPLALTRELRRKLPRTRIVVDFDDLMSRRFALLAERRLPLSVGYVRRLLPRAVVRFIEGPIARILLDYEARTLRAAEEEMLAICDAVTLVSSAEADLLTNGGHASLRQKVHAIVPPVEMRSGACRSRPPFRFVFIGSDRQTQNRLSLDVLTTTWAQLRPATPLHIYGSQTRKPPDIPGIRWHGFVSDLKEVYAPGSVLLIPGVLPGGIKTKVLEAFSFGCAVLGNPVAFEGLDIPNYPLRLPVSDWAPYLAAPDAHAATIETAADVGRRFVAVAGSRARYVEAWETVLAGVEPGEAVLS